MPPAVIDAGPVPSTTVSPAVVDGLRARLQDLEHALRFAIPRLRAVHDDPCQPAQRVLLADVIDNLTAAVTTGHPT